MYSPTLMLPVAAAAAIAATATAQPAARSCSQLLAGFCLKAVSVSVPACETCVGAHQHELRLAGCSGGVVKQWCVDGGSSGISVVASIPGRKPSTHFAVSARPASGGGTWQPVFVLETEAKNASEPQNQGYFSHLNGFTSSWASVMLAEANTAGVLLRVTRVGAPIKTASARPLRSGARVTSIDEDGVQVLVPSTARFTLTLDGGLDDVDTGPQYRGPPIHTFCAFVNPFLAPPAAGDDGVLTIASGAPIPTVPLPSAVTTLLFGPGEHRLPASSPGQWQIWALPDAVRVHVPADAVLYFALKSDGAENLTVDGFGTISGEEMNRCNTSAAAADATLSSSAQAQTGFSCDNHSPQGLSLRDFAVKRAAVTGVTFVDFPNHHIIAGATNKACSSPADIQSSLLNIKVMGWRANGDGIHVFGHWHVKDCFLRTQDDSLYLQAGNAQTCPTLFEHITTWNDANGAAFMLIGAMPTTLRASDAIYQRASYAWWDGGRIVTNRQQGSALDITIDGLIASDPFPTMNALSIDMRPRDHSQMAPATVRGVTIRNFHVAAFSTVQSCNFNDRCGCVPACDKGALPRGIPNIITGGPAATNNVTSLAFENCSIAGIDIATLLREDSGGGAFNISWEVVASRGITVDGKPIAHPPSMPVVGAL